MASIVETGGGYLVRASLYAAPAAYIAAKDFKGRDVKAIYLLYTPTLSVLIPGALEGCVRGVAHLALAYFKNDQWHTKACRVELDTAQRLLRGAFFPLNGCVLIGLEVEKFWTNQQRSLIHDYYVFSVPYQLGKYSFRYLAVPIARSAVIGATCAHLILGEFGVWSGLRAMASWSSRVIDAGVAAINRLRIQ